MSKKSLYLDVHVLEEDKRIDLIGKACVNGGTIAFIVDSEPGKADRYVRKLKEKFPGIHVLGRFDGPVPNVVTVKIRAVDAESN